MQFKRKATIIRRTVIGGLCALFVLCGGMFVSCGSAKGVADAQLGTVEDFTVRQLANEIPVIFKQNKGSKIVVLRIMFEGGMAAIDKSMSGIEDLALDLALRGSETYPYEKIQQLEYEKSFSLTSSSGRDYATAGFICIQRDLAEVLSLFTDCLLNPSFLEADFSQKMTEASAEITRKKADPSGSLGLAISKAVFANHPYAATSSVTEESYPNINLMLVKSAHQNLLNALRMKVVVVGNFSMDLIEDFVSELNTAIGTLPKNPFSAPKIPVIQVASGAVRVANEQAGDTGYVAGLFHCPGRGATDYIPFALASMYLDDLLFSQVREKAGAVYSINTGVLGGKELVGVISAYKVTEKQSLKRLICDAILSFDEEAFTKKLSQYKNQYISSIFSSAQTSSGVASSIISSIEYFGSESAYLKRADEVLAVDAKDAVAAYRTYFEPIAKENTAQWIVVDGAENLSKYDF